MDAMPCRYSHVDAFVPSMAPTGGNIIPGIPRFILPKLPFMGAGKKGSGKEASKAEAAKNSKDPELRQVSVSGGGHFHVCILPCVQQCQHEAAAFRGWIWHSCTMALF